jgi:cytochrome c oxidase cbb3-type subunit 1
MAQAGFFSSDRYNDDIVRKFALMAMVWGILGVAAGVYIAAELAFPFLNFDMPAITFGRLRPVHTTLVVFGFGGSVLFATSYYVVQRTCQVRLYGRWLPPATFWGWQLAVGLGALSYMLGYTQSREYAEFEWPIDLLIAVTWVLYFYVYVQTLRRRTQAHIYVANWFYVAFILATAVLHVFNNLAVPIGPLSMKSYSLFSGVQDAMTQWWYGHNVAGFFLTAAFLGVMYYFVPKQAGRPVYSYRLSIVHFWALAFLSVWVGAQHLHWTALPDWASTLAVTFSAMLLLPSLGGVFNGVMTLSGAWERLRTDPVMRFLITALAFYGLTSIEGPLMSLRSVNALSHYTDWTVGHAHAGGLGWVAMIAFGAFYHMVPRLYGTRLYSRQLVYSHFWLATIGIALYLTSMWAAGIMQGSMLRSFDHYGNLAHTFIETVAYLHWPYIFRLIGGVFFLTGVLMMAYNLALTVRRAKTGTAEPRARIVAKTANA